MIRSTGINDIKLNGCSHELGSQVKVNVAKVKNTLLSNSDTSIGYSTILSGGIPVSRT